jgi:TRAP-type C4-dicarboxylate transport system permease small subunit
MLTGLILLVLIVLFQLIVGSISLKNQISKRFRNTCILSLMALILFSYIGFSAVSNELTEKNIRCGMPLVGYLVFIFVISIVLMVIIGIQFFIRRMIGRRNRTRI